MYPSQVANKGSLACTFTPRDPPVEAVIGGQGAQLAPSPSGVIYQNRTYGSELIASDGLHVSTCCRMGSKFRCIRSSEPRP